MLTVDANVWVAAADRSDAFFASSREFLVNAAAQQLRIFLPAFALIEVACALARRRQDAEIGRRLASAILDSPLVARVPADDAFLAQALTIGTGSFLRGADALYAATAAIYASELVSWDVELLRRAGAVTPRDWLAANA